MNNFEKAITNIDKFYEIQPNEEFGNNIFKTLQKIINFNSGFIIFSNSKTPEYNFNTDINNIEEINSEYLAENLKFKNTIYGKIVIIGEKFNENDKKIFKACTSVISNITKDSEISKIIKMQIQALQKGYIEVKKSNKKIIADDKNKTSFISHVSHELRTPITSIMGYSELLDGEFAGHLNQKQKEFVRDIKISSIHLLGMVNEILDLSKIEANAIKLNMQEFQTYICIKEVINIMKPLILQKSIQLTENIEDFSLYADYPKIQQILFNLLSNAIKYTEENGKIQINCKKDKQNAIFEIIDNGIGIAPKQIKKIFNKFEQLNSAKPNSTGLGLAIVKNLIKLHKGSINVTSAINCGSKFSFTIPIK